MPEWGPYPWGFEPPGPVYCLKPEGAVTGSESQWPPGTTWEPVPEMPSAGDFREYQDELKQMYDAFWTLREDQPTIMRAYGWPSLWVPVWRLVGIETECTSNLEALDQARREVVEANGGVYVSMLDALNGPQRDEDPHASGLLQDDGFHLNEDGQQLLAETLAEAGFETSEPPNLSSMVGSQHLRISQKTVGRRLRPSARRGDRRGPRSSASFWAKGAPPGRHGRLPAGPECLITELPGQNSAGRNSAHRRTCHPAPCRCLPTRSKTSVCSQCVVQR